MKQGMRPTAQTLPFAKTPSKKAPVTDASFLLLWWHTSRQFQYRHNVKMRPERRGFRQGPWRTNGRRAPWKTQLM
jgi:hypothetical protein